MVFQIINKGLSRKVIKDCTDCGKKMNIFLYADKNKKNRGGHYFGKIGINSKKEMKRSLESGVKKWKFCGHTFYTHKYEAKSYKFLEHWECPKCYWGHRNNKVTF